MDLVVHAGVHQTDEDRLLRVLLRNAGDFAARGVAVPGPSNYRTLLKEGFLALEYASPAPDAREILHDAILDGRSSKRMILSNPHFFGSQRFAVIDGELYPLAALRMTQFNQLFDGDRIHLFLSIRNPATFLPSILRRASAAKMREVLAGRPPTDLCWSDMLGKIRKELPEMPITVWCNEDSPLIWADIVRAMAGLPPGQKISGGFDLLSSIMSPEGMTRFRLYLKQNPDLSEMHKRRVIEAFLGKYAIESELEMSIDLPGWTEPLIDALTALYDEDVARIAAMPGVTLLEP